MGRGYLGRECEELCFQERPQSSRMVNDPDCDLLFPPPSSLPASPSISSTAMGGIPGLPHSQMEVGETRLLAGGQQLCCKTCA